MYYFLIAACAIQLFVMSYLPLADGSDEVYHLLAPALIIDIARSKLGILTYLPAWLLAAAAAFIAFKRKTLTPYIASHRKMMALILLGALAVWCLALLYAGQHSLAEKLYNSGMLLRYPPLGKIINILLFSLFGISEFAGRLQSPVYFALSVFMLYKLVSLYRGRSFAVFTALIFGAFPVVFNYSYISYLDMGLVFYFIAASYFFLRHNLSNNFNDLLLTTYVFSFGFFNKHVILVLAFIFFIFFLLWKRGGIKDKAVSLWFMIAPAIPWMLILYAYKMRGYTFHAEYFYSFKAASEILLNMPGAITWPVFIIFLAAILWALAGKKDDLTRYSLLWFFVYYIFINGDPYHVHRLTLPFYPAAAIIIAGFIEAASSLLDKNGRLFRVFAAALVFFLFSCSTLINNFGLARANTLITAFKTGPYFPAKETATHIKTSIKQGSAIFVPNFSSLWFQLRKQGIYRKHSFYLDIPKELQSSGTLGPVFDFCAKNRIDYMVIPFYAGYPLFPSNDGFTEVNYGFFEELMSGRDKRFEKTDEFVFNDNKVIFWKIKR